MTEKHDTMITAIDPETGEMKQGDAAAMDCGAMPPAKAGKEICLPTKTSDRRVKAHDHTASNFTGHWQGLGDEAEYRRPLIDYLCNKYSVSETDAKRVITASVSFFEAMYYLDDFDNAWEKIYKAVTEAFGVSDDDDLSNMLFSGIPL